MILGTLFGKVQPASPEDGEFFSAAPIAVDGKVFIGTAGGDWGIRGKIFAFDAQSGKELWRFDTIPRPGQPGADSWPSEAGRCCGAKFGAGFPTGTNSAWVALS